MAAAPICFVGGFNVAASRTLSIRRTNDGDDAIKRMDTDINHRTQTSTIYVRHGRDIGAKQSFVASPGHDGERDKPGHGGERISTIAPRVRTRCLAHP